MASAFEQIGSPIYQVRYAALLAVRAAEAINESDDEIEIATLAVRHVAQLAQQLEDLFHELHAEAADAGLAAMGIG